MVGVSRMWLRLAAAVAVGAFVAPLSGVVPAVVRGAETRATNVESVCPAASPGTAECLALLRTDIAIPAGAEGAASPAATSGAYAPADIQSAYALPTGSQGSGRTVAVVDAYDLPTAESDLAYYRSYWGLPACTTANGCFRKINQTGGTTYPPVDTGWGYEIALDLDMVSAACPRCNILLVEANDNNFSNLGAAVNEAVSLGAVAVSNSYGGQEWSGETGYDGYFKHPGVAITASTGDCGYDCTGDFGGTTYNSVEWPAASPYVVAVGGTTLTPNASARGWTESAWGNSYGGAGSGCSLYEPKPAWQHDTGCATRTQADVSAVADPATGVYIFENSHWYIEGGTSAASPIIAAAYALAGGAAAGTYAAISLYAAPGDLNDVVGGNNDVTEHTCSVAYFCNGVAGYDGPTGLGTPNGIGAFAPLADPYALHHLVLSPAAAAITAGGSQTYTAEGFDALGDDLGSVTSSTTFTINSGSACPAHTCTSGSVGNHTVTGTDGTKTGTALLTVIAGTLDHLILSPADAIIPRGGSQSYLSAGMDAFGNGIGDVTAVTTFTILGGGSCTGTVCTSTVVGDHTVVGTVGSSTGTSNLHVTQAAVVGSVYKALTPTRVLDSRDGTGGLGLFHSHLAQTLRLAGGAGNLVPANATAVTGNLTVTQQTSMGFLYIGPVAMNDPTSSTLNFPLGDDRANGVTVALGAGGTLSVTYAAPSYSQTAHVIFDLTGYYVPGDLTGSTYHAMTPKRLLDSRNGVGGTSIFSSHVAQQFQVISVGNGVPANANAVTGNLTVTGQTAAGFLYIGPIQANNPTSSTLNFPRDDDRANSVTVGLGPGGLLWVTYAAPNLGPTAQAVFDVTGYFTPDVTGATYAPITPTRILDTRNGTGSLPIFSSHLAQGFQVTGTASGVPAGAVAATGNVTVTQQTEVGFLYVGPDKMNNPTSSTLNFPIGDDRANAVTVALSATGGLWVTYAAPRIGPTAQVIFDVTGYFVQ